MPPRASGTRGFFPILVLSRRLTPMALIRLRDSRRPWRHPAFAASSASGLPSSVCSGPARDSRTSASAPWAPRPVAIASRVASTPGPPWFSRVQFRGTNTAQQRPRNRSGILTALSLHSDYRPLDGRPVPDRSPSAVRVKRRSLFSMLRAKTTHPERHLGVPLSAP